MLTPKLKNLAQLPDLWISNIKDILNKDKYKLSNIDYIIKHNDSSIDIFIYSIKIANVELDTFLINYISNDIISIESVSNCSKFILDVNSIEGYKETDNLISKIILQILTTNLNVNTDITSIGFECKDKTYDITLFKLPYNTPTIFG